MSRPKQRNVSFSEHGAKLSASLEILQANLEKNRDNDSLASLGFFVFKVTLPEGERIQDKEEIFTRTGLEIKAVKTVNKAIVSTSKSRFQILTANVERYRNTGLRKSYFDFIDDYEVYSGQEKNSSELRKTMCAEQLPETLDIQLMLLPNMAMDEYNIVLTNLKKKLGNSQKSVYRLSDGTPVVRALIEPSTLTKFENDSAIFRIEETDFFNVPSDIPQGISIEDFKLAPDVDLGKLPVVVVLDNGVKSPKHLKELVVDRWVSSNTTGGDCSHGTRVASLVSFRNFKIDSDRILRPRVRIIDCNILDGNVPIDEFISRIQNSVIKYVDKSKIFNLSANSKNPIDGDEMSILGYELDVLQQKNHVQFIVSAGNHYLWKYNYSLEEILDDDDSIISSPADSMLSIVVGATAGCTHDTCISKNHQIAPYSRRGPGFKDFSKPDMTAYAGVIVQDNGIASVPQDNFSLSLDKTGFLSPDAGTSFSAPIISGDLAEILGVTEDNLLLAKALMYHNAKPLWNEDEMTNEDLWGVHNLYGRGFSDVDSSKYSSPSRVTFLRTGILNRTSKERIKFYMPDILAAQPGRNVAKVTVTCISLPPVDRTKGTEYLGAYIRATLKKAGDTEDVLRSVSPIFREGHQKWDVCSQFSQLFTSFNAGDWQVWLELFARWELKDENVPYALVVTIEDLSGQLDIYQEIKAQNRFRTIAPVRIRVKN